ncbi:hypothetical protein Pedsa_1478 [Pseudopedobacter saltans DSM 12145]|uniref:DUF3185 domain-containing protein n=1 Tax=Pseudopedobacter saltans (strain ATCC 51119 / DSM 12145 / JCM 21818 / CCUG 39354 / LMG 10337 / NBRC 100064 / NCIMB 13643) TaxID=762903 RepID=F0S594_PSESL|nr:hypothetical protein [Pseudopedobacter saltans]ADY52039.1 hypothetical protein Pedsa_1478 [Pseudopedobacter saltans DSM 12145]
MKRTIGIILVIIGIAMLVLGGGFSFTKKEKVIDAGPLEVTADKKEHVNWPPYVGGIVLVVGVVLAVSGNKNS